MSFLNISLFIFLLSLTAAGFTAWRLNLIPVRPSAQPASLVSANDPTDVLDNSLLMPNITVSPSLTSQQNTLTQQLITPLRLYYATRPEKLTAIKIEPANHEDFATLVTLQVETSGNAESVTFLYGSRAENQPKYNPWTPSQLDNTP